LKTSDKVKGVVVTAGNVTALAPCRQPSQIGEAARVSRKRENMGEDRGVSGGIRAVTWADPRRL
jgi:hypothetical protein